MKPVNLLIVGHDLRFLTPFVSATSAFSDISVRVYSYHTHSLSITDELLALSDWATVVFCEWALDNAVWFSNNLKSHQKLIIRLHSQEVRGMNLARLQERIDWNAVDRLVVISPAIRDYLVESIESLKDKMIYIPNPISHTNLRFEKKHSACRYVVGMVGIVPALKRVDLALNVIRMLREVNERFVLKIKGKLPAEYPWMSSRARQSNWYSSVFEKNSDLITSGSVIFDPYGDDMADWYRNVGHIVSTSDSEGSHQTVAEGMICGCIPAIRSWGGADRIYPVNFVCDTVEDIVELVLRNSDIERFWDLSFSSNQFATKSFCSNNTVGNLIRLVRDIAQ